MRSEIIARQVVVHGLVQGVGFRWSALNAATGMGVTGWVRNQDDGTVKCVLEGTPQQVKNMLEWLQHGPRYAHVTRVDVVAADPIGFGSFEMRN